MINFHFNDFSMTQSLAAQFESQLKQDVDSLSYYSANMAMVYRDGMASPPPDWSNGSQPYNGMDAYGQDYIFDPNDGYGFLNPNNFSGIPIPDVQEAQSYYSILALSTRQAMGALVHAVPSAANSYSSLDSNVSEPLTFLKEISSDGNVNTVDVLYPSMPFTFTRTRTSSVTH